MQNKSFILRPPRLDEVMRKNSILRGVLINPEIVQNIARCNYNWDLCKRIHFWNGNESENPFLIPNFTKRADCFFFFCLFVCLFVCFVLFFDKIAKNHFLVKKL